jgi:hypothetical protein
MPGGGWLEDADNGGNSDEGDEEGKTDRIMLDTGLNREGGGADGAVALSLANEEIPNAYLALISGGEDPVTTKGWYPGSGC